MNKLVITKCENCPFCRRDWDLFYGDLTNAHCMYPSKMLNITNDVRNKTIPKKCPIRNGLKIQLNELEKRSKEKK